MEALKSCVDGLLGLVLYRLKPPAARARIAAEQVGTSLTAIPLVRPVVEQVEKRMSMAETMHARRNLAHRFAMRMSPALCELTPLFRLLANWT